VTPVASKACGVGHIPVRAIWLRLGRTAAPGDALWLLPYSVADGVGRKLRGGRPPLLNATAFVLLASGVGNNPEPLAEMWSSNGGSG